MRRHATLGFAAGALCALGLGITIAVLPSTPTWALWRLTVAIDERDAAALQSMVDVSAVVHRALEQDLGVLGATALTLLRGGRVRTTFDEPGVEVSAGDFLAAWWSLRRSGESAQLELPLGARSVRVEFTRGPDRRWRISGVSPLDALLHVESPGA